VKPEIDRALRRARRRAPLPKDAPSSARALWLHVTDGSGGSVAVCNIKELRVPSMRALADGCVALAREQAASGIRTVKGRRARPDGPVTVRTPKRPAAET